MSLVERKGNRVIIWRKTGPGELPALYTELHRAIQAGGTSRVILDFSGCTAMFQRVMLPLLPLIAQYRQEHGVRFTLNVTLHAESPVGGFVQATACRTANAVEFVVADAGIGIAATMNASDDVTALREGGMFVRRIIRNLLRAHRTVVLDFEGVGVFTSSFADEVFGRLFVPLGPRAFMTRIRMRHVDETVEGLIDRAILQRTRLGNGDLDLN